MPSPSITTSLPSGPAGNAPGGSPGALVRLLSPFRHAAGALLSPLDTTRFVVAVIASAALLALRPSTWTATVRTVLARQVYFTGLGALPITVVAGLMVGVSIIAQSGVWLAQLDQSALFGPLIAYVVIQNLGPLLINFFIIGRSGTAMATELANMSVHHEIEVIESQGVDPFIYLVVPRVVATAVSVFCLTVLFVAAALLGAYLFGVAMQIPALGGGQFSHGIFLALTPGQMGQFLLKTIVPGMATGAICCVYGLRVEPVLTGVPQAATRASVASVWAMFAVMVIGALAALV